MIRASALVGHGTGAYSSLEKCDGCTHIFKRYVREHFHMEVVCVRALDVCIVTSKWTTRFVIVEPEDKRHPVQKVSFGSRERVFSETWSVDPNMCASLHRAR